MPSAKVKSLEPNVGDVLSHLDEVVRMTQRARREPSPFPPEFMDGYLRALTDFRRYIRSENFAIVVRSTKETPSAHRP